MEINAKLHIVRTVAITLLTISAGVGAIVSSGEVRTSMLTALGLLVPAFVDSALVLRKGTK